jgi:cobalt-zinc-cadmium efflux system outer membrane protein
MAEQELALVRLEAEIIRNTLRAEALRRYLELVYLQERSLLLGTMAATAESTRAHSARLVQAGAARTMDLTRAEIALAELLLEQQALQRSQAQVWRELAALWSNTGDTTRIAAAALPHDPVVPSYEQCVATLPGHPEVRRQGILQELGKAAAAGARSSGVPDITAQAGFIRDNAGRANSVRLSASIPLPLFDQNQGAVDNLVQEQVVLQSQTGQLLLDKKAELRRSLNAIEAAAGQLKVLRETMAPKAQSVYAESMRFYTQGAAGMVEVLTAQAELSQLLLRILDTTKERALRMIDLAQTAGIDLDIFAAQ